MSGVVRCERLESRRLMSAPKCISITADNRGEVLITFDQPLISSTVSGRSVQMHTPGADGLLGNADDVKVQGRVRWTAGSNRIRFITDQLPANATYYMKVSSKIAKGLDGTRIDGEFNGPGLPSGDGNSAGDLLFVAKRDKGTNPIARMTTSLGAINVKLFRDQTPITVNNFQFYADTVAWDGTFFHRSVRYGSDNSPFIIQGGGFDVKSDNTLGIVPHNPPVTNEPGISNKRGTIAMAKISVADPPEFPSAENSATNQFFFNEQDVNAAGTAQLDNPQNNGGFTVFGQITNSGGLAVMDAIGGLTDKDLRKNGAQTPATDPTNGMDHTPVLNANATAGTLNPSADLVVIRRVALIDKISAFVVQG